MSFNQVPAGHNAPEDVFCIIEIPAEHSPIKYEIDKAFDCLMVDRFMTAPMFYPANYGFIPKTLGEDGDPIDMLVITPCPLAPGAVIRCRPVGVLNMTDEAGGDAKLIAVPHEKVSKAYAHVQEYGDLPALLIQQIEHFFEHYKALEPEKWVKIAGWENAATARRLIEESIHRYQS